MQIAITAVEKKNLIALTNPHGRSKWFYEKAGISWASLQKLRTFGQADEDVVTKARKVLQSKDAKEFIGQKREAKIFS